LAFVVEPDGDETEVRASLRVEADGWWGGDLIGPADWIGLTESTEPFFELRLPDGRSGVCFVRAFDQVSTANREHRRRHRRGPTSYGNARRPRPSPTRAAKPSGPWGIS